MKKNFRLRSLLLAVLVGSNALVFIVSGVSLHNSRQQHEREAETQTQNIAKAIDQSLSASIEKIDLTLRAVADELERQLGAGGIDEQAMSAFLRRHEQRLPEVEAFRVSDSQGQVILGKGLTKKGGTSWADRDYFIYHRDHTDQTLQVSKPVFGRVAQKYIVGFGQRYNYPDGRFGGVISAPIPLSHFTHLLAQFTIGPNGTIVLRDADAGLITRSPEVPDKPAGQLGNNVVSPELQKIIRSGVHSSTYFTPASADGFERMVSFSRLSKAPMLFIVGAASEDYLAPWKEEVFKTSIMAFGYFLLSLLSGGFIFRLLNDLEQRKQALAEREVRLKTIIQNEPECIKVVDAEGRLIEMNPAGLAIIQADTLDQVAMQPVLDLIAPEHRPQFAEMHRRVIAGASQKMEFEVVGLQGRRRWLETHAVPMQDNDQILHLAITRDITQRKQSEAELLQYRHQLEQMVAERTSALLETEARASHIVQSSSDGLYGVDDRGIITFINPAACELLGYSAEQAIGHNSHTLFHHIRSDGTHYPAEECPSHSAMQLGKKIRVDNEVYLHADGHAVPVMYAVHPIMLNGISTGAVISFVDMSEQRAAAQIREQALIAAENLARVRSEFLANMSHEIRTPLNGVLGFAEIGLRNHHNSDKAHDAFSKIVLSGKRLLGVINDILDFSKIEAGKLSIEEIELDLQDVIGHSIELVRDRADAKGLNLRVVLSPELPRHCLGDPLRIGQVLLNILTNAVKFTEKGDVTLSVSCVDQSLVFRIVDTGIGMTETQLGDLFTPFQQADASATRRFGGTGLGLAISKHILELMHGDIRVESRLGAGTLVEFRVPHIPSGEHGAEPGRTDHATSMPLVARPLQGLSFLVAEDEAINQEIIRDNLIEDGARVVIVSNGREAVERIISDGSDAYDIVLMDLQMPEMDGYEATRRIRALAPDLPIIAQTAHAFSEEREKCLAAGMVGHVAKPIDVDALVELVRRHTTGQTCD